MRIGLRAQVGVALGLALAPGAAYPDPPPPARVDYNRDLRPILSDLCYRCHGPDEGQRKAGLRLDTREGALAELRGGRRAIVPGKSAESALPARIAHPDPKKRMPPASTGKALTPAQVELIRSWIDQGAEWRQHWSFIRAERPAVPEARAPQGGAEPVLNPIDSFIRARLAREGLSPSPPADPTTLARRATLDLTGLPPGPAELDAHLADGSAEAYERLVDRLLASPRFGEHLARYWLDAARYGDTHGLHLDNERSLWPYRDWVINAFNRNLPFDAFTTEQLAGDLLPNATLDQRIATGFNRCNVTTSEGGAIDEEWYVRYAVDRVETTGTVWMGLTIGCAVCHDHKFDPIRQAEFYQLFAFFNSLTEKPMDGNALLPPPFTKVPRSEDKERLRKVEEEIRRAEARLEAPIPEVDAAQASWEGELAARIKGMWRLLEPAQATCTGGTSLKRLDDGSLLAEAGSPEKEVYEVTARTEAAGITAIRLEALRHESLPGGGAGRAENSNFVLSEIEVAAAPAGRPGESRKLAFTSALADHSQKGFEVQKAIDGNPATGWAVDGPTRREDRTALFFPAEPFGFPGGSEIKVRLRQEHGGRHTIGRLRLSVTSEDSLAQVTVGSWRVAGPFPAADGSAAFAAAFGPESRVDLGEAFLDGKVKWVRRPELEDGKVHSLEGQSCATYLFRRVQASGPRKLALSLGSDDGLKVWVNGSLVLERNVTRAVAPDQERITVDLKGGENQLLLKVVNHGGGHGFYFRRDSDESARELIDLGPVLAVAAEQRSAEQKQRLRDRYRGEHSPEWKALQAKTAGLKKERQEIEGKIPGTMVMEEMAQRRDAFVLIRGEYDRKGEKVLPGVPAVFPPLPEGAPPTRLGLARWLVDRSHPLTARVFVNRLWQQVFGTGIVKTSNDFGSQGEWPVHPELLDWLAVEFIDSGWDVKRMLKLMLTSATYRQSARVRPQELERDPENRLLARGPRFRLDAEVVRDTALAAGGLLVERLGGPSVKPYQPTGIWEAVGFVGSNTRDYKQEQGDALYRRSLYTFWKRTSPPPALSLLDAPTRESCSVLRARTNTPLQALALLNDVQFFEAARRLGERMLKEGGERVEEQIAYGFRLATARRPDAEELETLVRLHGESLEQYARDLESAKQLLGVGDSKHDAALDPARLAAAAMVANLLLNLDETVTKG